MSGSAAKKIRQLIGYDKKNQNPIQKKLYKSLKARYLAMGAEEFWKSVEGRFNNK
jgi:hypothetical protein|tara:strand:+ start:24915 stop:25079 length:165 start_codon:yes stop_codon:yes gene_type:complete